MRQPKPKEFSASEITQYAIKVLTLQGYCVWRNNNLAVKGRTFIGRKGCADITGFKRGTGVRIEVEVKKIGDVLSQDQRKFLSEVSEAGGIALIASQNGSEIILEPYKHKELKK